MPDSFEIFRRFIHPCPYLGDACWTFQKVKCSAYDEPVLDSTAVSIFVVMLVELINTVFVNSTDIQYLSIQPL